MAYKERIKICVSGAADLKPCCPRIRELARRIGQAIAKEDCILLTGATTGVPYEVAKGYKQSKGRFSIGFSPAGSKREHERSYRLPTDQFDLIVYTGFDYVGRNLILSKSADGVIIICGRTGTLNEFTVAFETRTPIGILQESGGVADYIDDILKRGHRPITKVIYRKEPRQLVKDLLKIIKQQDNQKQNNN